MGKMKELDTIGKDLQRQLASGQLFAPTFEELKAMQDSYLDFLRLLKREPERMKPRDDQTSIL